MRLVIKPDSNDMKLIIEASAYQKMWRQYSRPILRAFREVTGLEFPQTLITARVYHGEMSTAGRLWVPMKLAAAVNLPEHKLMTLVHELSHRLLNGNGLGLLALGLAEPYDKTASVVFDDDLEVELSHRHLYLFEHTVVIKALGEEWGAWLAQCESSEKDNTAHKRAWEWAMSRSEAKRMIMLKRLVAYTPQLEEGEEFDYSTVKRRKPDQWFRYLETGE